MVFVLSVLNREYNFERVFPYFKQGIASTINLVFLIEIVCNQSIQKE